VKTYLKSSLHAAALNVAHARFFAVSNVIGQRLNPHKSPRQISPEIENTVSESPRETESKAHCRVPRSFW